MIMGVRQLLQFLYRALIELTNGKWSSFILKKFAQSRVSRFVIPSFAKVYRIDLEEMEFPINEYTSLNHFFTRNLKPGMRMLNNEESSIISPVDGMIEAAGNITPELMMRVKGKSYSVLDMLGTEEKATKYMSGSYMIIYLSPSNYHRIHSPFSGTVTGEWTLGGKSYPVNKWGLKYGRGALSKNFRKITEMRNDSGHAALVKVGAMFVNSIETTYKGEEVQKGEELAYFSFGSTVILLFEKNTFELHESLKLPAEIRMGEVIGYFKENVDTGY